jgi:large subunit ribosomal protein L18
MHKAARTVRRRRKEAKTDYKQRTNLLKSGKPRIVFRKTNKYVIGQVVSSEVAQDKVIMGANSKELLVNGWPDNLKGSLKSMPACYLTGYLLGKKSKDTKQAILDIGLNRNIKKSRIYAFLKGVVDAGVDVAHSTEALPEMETIEGKGKAGDMIKKIKEKIK